MSTNTRTRRIAAAVAVCTIVAGGLLYLSYPRGNTANASPGPELLSALPPGAPTLVFLDLAAVRASSFYQHRPDKGPIAIPSPEYADFVRSTGFDFEKDLDRVVIASWPNPSGKEQRKDVVIAEGRFDRAKIRDYASRNGTLDHQQGRDVYLFSTGVRTGTESLTFLDDHRLALVAGASIAPLFASGSGDSVADPARERAARLDGAAAFMITPVPAIPDNTGSPQAAQFVSLVRSVQWITLAARPEGDDLRVSLEGECDNSTDAQQLKSMLEVLRMFGRAGLDNAKTTQSMNPASLAMLQSLLSGAEVTQSAERVRILLELTPDIFKLGETAKPQAH
jgi:hypothetical protein